MLSVTGYNTGLRMVKIYVIVYVDDSYIGNAEDYPEVVKNRTIAWQRLKDD
jgi:hypothetical protein